MVDGEFLEGVDLGLVSYVLQCCLGGGYDLLSSFWSLLCIQGLKERGREGKVKL